jgi:hypothetical protein
VLNTNHICSPQDIAEILLKLVLNTNHICSPQDIAEIGVKHHSINHLKKLLSFMKPVKFLPANYVS